MRQNRLPGPIGCRAEVYAGQTGEMINHRGPEFAEILLRVTEAEKIVLETKADVLNIPGSGTYGLESAVVSFFSPGDKVLVCRSGHFGEEFERIARMFQLNVVPVVKPHGGAIYPVNVDDALKQNPDCKGVLVTHNETSTGVTNPLASIAQLVRERRNDALVIVDGVSSVGAIPCRMDAWDLDVVVNGSQKGLMATPGLAIVAVSNRAWEAHKKSSMPRYCLDLGRALEYYKKGQTPTTPPETILFGLDVALKILLAEGMENVYARIKDVATTFRAGIEEMDPLGFTLFAEYGYQSNTVTAVKVPPHINVDDFLRRLEKDHGILAGSAKLPSTTHVFRLGHMGPVTKREIKDCLTAIEAVYESMPLPF